MTVRPYSDGGSKREQVERMFDTIAPTYDRINRFSSLGTDQCWRRKLIRALVHHRPEHVLDVATGTGDLAIMAARKGMRVTGIDISEGMLGQARIKVARSRLADRIALQRADSEDLPFAEAGFDAAMVAFGARNFAHLDKGLTEMRRVLKPGGLLLVLEFSRPRGVIGPFFRLYFHRVMPLIGRTISRDPAAYTYLPKSVDAFPDGREFLDILRSLDLHDAQARQLSGGIATLYTALK